MGQGVFNQLSGGMNVELFHDSALVKLDGPDGNSELRRDFLDRVTFGHELQYFPLTAGQIIE